VRAVVLPDGVDAFYLPPGHIPVSNEPDSPIV